MEGNNEVNNIMDDIILKDEPWYMELLDNLEYYLIYKPKQLFYNIKWYFKNRILFNKIIKTWRPWDYVFQMELFAFGLEQLKKSMENGNEERESANKKIKACGELIYQLRRNVEDELEWDKENESLSDWERRYLAENNHRFDEIHRLMKGQDPTEYRNTMNKSSQDGYKDWVDWFDGSGIQGWWD